MSRRVRVAGLTLLVLLAAGGAYAVWSGDDDPGPAPTLREYQPGQRPPAPPIAGETLAGGHLDVADLRGDVVVVNIWASWCGPCRAETADLEEVHQDTQGQGVSFVGVNMNDNHDKATAFVAGRVTYPSIFDPGSEYALGFTDPPPPIGPPATLVIDRTGDLAATIYRQVAAAELRAIVERVAAEALADG